MTIRTIVVGCDLSAQSDEAIERAVGIAELHKARIYLVHAQADDAPIEEVDAAMLARLGEVTAAVRAQSARGIADRMAQIQARGLEVECVSRIGPPGEILAQVALEHAAELMVVGTHGATGISRFLLGSVASEAVRHAPCDVLVCRGTTARAPFVRPIVAMDFSPTAVRALEHASELVAPGTTIEVVHAWQLPTGSWGATLLGQARFPWSTVRDAVLTSAKAQADRLVASYQGSPIHVELLQGPPASVVTTRAEQQGHDLIVVGTHGNRGFRRLLLGSVAEGVLRHAPCSVLVVHGENAGQTAKFKKQ